jgi:hypothetical protein
MQVILFDVFQEVLLMSFISLVSIAKEMHPAILFLVSAAFFLFYYNYYKYFQNLHLTKWNSANLFAWANITRGVSSKRDSKPIILNIISLILTQLLLVGFGAYSTFLVDYFHATNQVVDTNLAIYQFFIKILVHFIFWSYLVNRVAKNWTTLSIHAPWIIFLLWVTVFLSTTLILISESHNLGVLGFFYLWISRYIVNHYLHPIVVLFGVSIYTASAAVFFFYITPPGLSFIEFDLPIWTLICILFLSTLFSGWYFYSIYQWREEVSWYDWTQVVYFLRECIKWITRWSSLFFAANLSETSDISYLLWKWGLENSQIHFFNLLCGYLVIKFLVDVLRLFYHLFLKSTFNIIVNNFKLWYRSNKLYKYYWLFFLFFITLCVSQLNLPPVFYILGIILCRIVHDTWQSEQAHTIWADSIYRIKIISSIIKFLLVLGLSDGFFLLVLRDLDNIDMPVLVFDLCTLLLYPPLPYLDFPLYFNLNIELFSFTYYRWITPYVSERYKLTHRWVVYYLYSVLIILSFLSFLIEWFLFF